jgi:hypothetical protein
MSGQLDFKQRARCLVVENRQSAGPVADQDIARTGSHSHIVRIIAEMDLLFRVKGRSRESAHPSVTGGNDEVGTNECHSLRLMQPFNPRQCLTSRQIDKADCSLAELCHSEPISSEVDGEVIDASLYITKGDACFNGQGLMGLRSNCRHRGTGVRQTQQDAERHAARPFHGFATLGA